MEITAIKSGDRFAIGPIIVEPGRNIISQGEDVFALEPKIMDVLEYLALRQGDVCSRDDIIEAVWKVEYGADESLTRAISIIRKALRQAGGKGRYIQTIPKRGYSLQEPVAKLTQPAPKQTTFVERPKDQVPSIEQEEVAATTFVASPEPSAPKLAQVQKPKVKTIGVILALIMGAGATVWALQGPQVTQTIGGELAISPYGRSVAVMPFVDLSVDKAHQYFSDGMAEELSNELRKIDDLRIVGQRLGGKADYNEMSYEQVGDKLSVSHIIHGSVRTQADKVRITAQLINTEDNSHVWSSNYDGTLDDIFELQQRVASDIVLELSLVLSLNISDSIDLGEVLPLTLAPEAK